ncbi:MAG: Hsp20/alpha crystallin family protein [Candidatus Odinarchaeia archaeon]
MNYGEDEFDELFKKLWDKFIREFRLINEVELENPELHQSGCIEPLIHVYEEDGTIVITADLPKVKKDDIKINVDSTTVEIIAKLYEKINLSELGNTVKQIEACRFHKTIRLPYEIKPEEAKAEFKKGILIIKLPKKKEVYSVKID